MRFGTENYLKIHTECLCFLRSFLGEEISAVDLSLDPSQLRAVFASTMLEMANIVSHDQSANNPFPLLPLEQNPLPDQVRKSARHLQLLDFIFSKDIKLGLYAWNRGGPAHTLPPQVSLCKPT